MAEKVWTPTTIDGKSAFQTEWPYTGYNPVPGPQVGENILVAMPDPYPFSKTFITIPYTITSVAGSLVKRGGGCIYFCYAEPAAEPAN